MEISQPTINIVCITLWSVAGVWLIAIFVSRISKRSFIKYVTGLGAASAVMTTHAVATHAAVHSAHVTARNNDDPWRIAPSEASSTTTTVAVPTTTSVTTTSDPGFDGTTTSTIQPSEKSQPPSELPQHVVAPTTQTESKLKREVHTVVAGDNLWNLARVYAAPGEDFISLWKSMIAENTSTLRSGNPNLIYPGEQIIITHVISK